MTDRLDDLWRRTNERRQQQGERLGQALFNALAEVDEALARDILTRHPEADPFYKNEEVSLFLLHVIAAWANETPSSDNLE